MMLTTCNEYSVIIQSLFCFKTGLMLYQISYIRFPQGTAI